MEIEPAHMQLQVLPSSKADTPPIFTSAIPGDQGVTVAGIQGMGVNTPRAAVVAVATTGLDKEEHIPKVMILTNGTWSIMVAAGMTLVFTLFKGSTIKLEGAAPKEHVSIAPLHT